MRVYKHLTVKAYKHVIIIAYTHMSIWEPKYTYVKPTNYLSIQAKSLKRLSARMSNYIMT